MIRFLAAVRFAVVTAGQNFVRNFAISIAAVFVMCLILVMAGGTLLLIHMSDAVLAQEQARASNIKVYLHDGISQASSEHFRERLAADPRIRSARYESKEQADVDAVAQGLPASVGSTNPYPASINLDFYQIGDLAAVDAMVRAEPLVDRNGRDTATTYNADVVPKLQSLIHYVELAGLIMGLILGFISLVIIMVTIRTAVAIRQREIEIMKLVGATDWFVRLPFIIEGVMSGVIAALAASGLVALTYHPIIAGSRRAVGFFPFTEDTGYLAVLLVVLLAGGAVLGAVGSYLGVRRFLTV